MKSGSLILIKKVSGDGKIPVGFEAAGIFYDDSIPTVGQRYRCGGFLTGVITKTYDNIIETESKNPTTGEITVSTYELAEQTEAPVKVPEFGKINSNFDSVVIDDDKPGLGIYANNSESHRLAEKLSSACSLAQGDIKESMRILLPTLTNEEVVFLIGSTIHSALKKETPKVEGSLEDLLKYLKEKRKRGE